MRYRRVLAITTVILAAALSVPSVALAITTDVYGRSYSGQASCLSCHDGLKASDRRAYVGTRHDLMVIDVRANPAALVPSGTSTTFWPSPGIGTTGIRFGASNVFLQIGGGPVKEYVTTRGEALPSVSAIATVPVPSGTPADDLILFDGITYDTDEGAWIPEAPVSTRAYYQRCGSCHNLGVTRPSNDTKLLASGAQISPTTPTSIQGTSIQCEVCHGTGKTTTLHEAETPEVLAWTSSNAAPSRLMSAELCGQCHATGTAKEHMYASATSFFSSPNGYTSDATLSAFFDVVTYVPTEASFTVNPTAYRFYPNGDNRNLNHVYYNEWLNNKASNGYGHANPTNSSAAKNPKCLRCHSGEGFLERIGDPIVPASYDASSTNVKWGITCQVCHSVHDVNNGLATRVSTDPEIGTVDCGDCHNWQFEVLDQQVPTRSAFETGYAGQRVRHPQREMNAGVGLFGVAPAGQFMDDVECAKCHMPESREARFSHRFHVMLPGDAEEWGVREGGDSCTPCHPSRTRAQLQENIDTWQFDTDELVAEATSTMDAARTRMGWTGSETSFIGTSSTDPQVVAYKMAFHNRDFVQNDGSRGAHNPTYAQAGLRYSIRVARSIGGSAALSAPLVVPYDTDAALIGAAVFGDDTLEAGEDVELQARPVGETDFTTFETVVTNGLGTFTGAYRVTKLVELRAVWKSPSGDKISAVRTVSIGSYGGVVPVDRASGADRYATSVAASAGTFTTGAVRNIVLASGEGFADALAANGLAGVAGSPLLLTAQDALPGSVRTEIDRVSPAPAETTVWLVGGASAIGEGIADELTAAGYTVKRIGGADRYETAALIAAQVANTLGAAFPGEAFLVSGSAFPDGIAAAPISYATGRPVLLASPSGLPAATADAIDDLGITKVYAVGGAAAVSDEALAALPAGSARVAAGADRYETAADLAGWAIDEGLATTNYVGVASGAKFPDALSAGAPAGAAGGVVLLSAQDALSPPASAFLGQWREDVGKAVVFGGTSALADAVRSAVYEALNP